MKALIAAVLGLGFLLSRPEAAGALHRQALELMERVVIQAAVEHTGGNMAGAARLLGISRTTLRIKMDRLALNATVKVRPKPLPPVHINGQ